MPTKTRVLLLLTFLLAFFLRFYGIDWDRGHHLHPDERMIIMVADRIKMDSLNPKFFAYGSFPIYLLAGISSILDHSNYDGMLYVGRTLSVIFDVSTTLIVFYITFTLTNKPRTHDFIPHQIGAGLTVGSLDTSLRVSPLNPRSDERGIVVRGKYKAGLLAAFFYAMSVLPIQAAHFYAVDTTLTFLSSLTLLVLIKFLIKPMLTKAILIGTLFGLALATKITILLLFAPILVVLLLIYYKTKSVKKLFVFSFLIFHFSFLIFFVAMPYAIIDKVEFIKQITLQLQMNKNAYIFPYTLQYVGTTPYIYYLKNIVLWGLGLPLGIIALISVVYQTVTDFRNTKKLILIIFFWVYFLVVGRSAVKFMRYLLPLYPLFAIFAGIFVIQLISRLKQHKKFSVICYLLIVGCLVWPLSFIKIYSHPPTRVWATEWINNNIPYGSNIAVEHWDDRLPLTNSQEYQITDLPLYEPDSKNKWNNIVDILVNSEYIIIASNRLYTPLPKLTDCAVHKNHCYPITANYYNQLFSGNLGFEQTKTFEVYPKVPIFNFQVDDLEADESFTVYDHPKVMIFKKTENLTKSELLNKLLSNNL